jgi:GNAT superfamily N-acetyltransferase
LSVALDDTGASIDMPPSKTSQGLVIESISPEEFREFAARYASSPEIGPIETYLDKVRGVEIDPEKVRLFGLRGCGLLGSVACFTVKPARHGVSLGCKLDSVIVHPRLRKRGLATLLVSEAFRQFFTRFSLRISHIYAHSVHPATVSLLRRLRFTDPSITGAPISSIEITDDVRESFIADCRMSAEQIASHLKLQCATCMKNPRRARRWCLHEQR